MGIHATILPNGQVHRELVSHDPATLAQLGERQTEDLKVPGSIPGLGIIKSNNIKFIIYFLL